MKMEVRSIVTFIVIHAICISEASASILDECLNETLTISNNCSAKPVRDKFFPQLIELLNEDTSLVVIEVNFENDNSSSRHRFDLVKTDVGETLLTLKSQMEFLTINLPLLSKKVSRRSVYFRDTSEGCTTRYAVLYLESILKNWLICGLTKLDKNDELYLSVRKLCVAQSYEEPNEWYLFRDSYYHLCCDKADKNATCTRLDEDWTVIIFKRALNYGVTSIALMSMILLMFHRRLFFMDKHIFQCQLQNTLPRVCKIVQDSEEDDHVLEMRRGLRNCRKCNNNLGQYCKNLLSDQLKTLEPNQKYDINICGALVEIGSDRLITCRSFGLICLLKSVLEECSAKKNRSVCIPYFFFVVDILITTGCIIACYVAMFWFYKLDPFHALSDCIASSVVLFVAGVSKLMTKVTLGFCNNKIIDMIQSVLHEMLFFLIAYFVVAIGSRVLVILLLGLSLQPKSNIYTLIASAGFFVLLQGYYTIKKTHRKYLEFLKMCLKMITGKLNESSTLGHSVYRNRLITSVTLGDIEANQKLKHLVLTVNGDIALFYLSNGEPAILKDFFLELCKSNIYPSPGYLLHNVAKALGKFIFWAVVVAAVIYLQHIVAEKFDHSFYDLAPSTIASGLLPILLNYVFFPDTALGDDINFTRLLNQKFEESKKMWIVRDLDVDPNPAIHLATQDKDCEWTLHYKNDAIRDSCRFTQCCCALEGVDESPNVAEVHDNTNVQSDELDDNSVNHV